MRARKRFGQHFLVDEAIPQQISAALNLNADDRLLEIGPGRGALTAQLHGQPGRYVAVELDRDLAPLLGATFVDMKILSADVLKLDLAELLSDGDWRIVGNLPYNISTPLLVKMFSHTALIRDMHFMLQREVGERLAADPGTKAWGRLSVLAQYHCHVEALFDVAPSSFKPVPRVWSTFVRLMPWRDKLVLDDPGSLDVVLRHAFSGRRKLITNALKSLDVPWNRLHIDETLRADQLSVGDFVTLANVTNEEMCR